MVEQVGPNDLRIRTFCEKVEDDVISLVNTYTIDWPYSIPIDTNV